MNLKHKSIFNLIEIFSAKRAVKENAISHKEHCDKNQLSDFYCRTEIKNDITETVGLYL